MNTLVPAALFFSLTLPLFSQSAKPSQPKLGYRSTQILHVDGLEFKDLNHNGKLDLYEDWRQTPEARAKDLVNKLTVEEIAGLMMHGTVPITAPSTPKASIGGGYDLAKAKTFITETEINSFITRLNASPRILAESNNQLQEIAETSRLGIPVTVSTDPRSHFQYTPGASVESGAFSKWPETTGLAAIGDPAMVRRFGDLARREYLAVGIRENLAPQADLSTEPRWARINGTFGEDAQLAKRMVQAFVEGFQVGDAGLNPNSVSTVVKHWAGYGAAKDGLDSHSSYGRYATFPGNNFKYHLIPFTGAFDAHVAGVMPTYSILQGVSIEGKPVEQVGSGYDAQLLTGLLRGTYKFQGVIVSDWGITNDCSSVCLDGVPAGEKPAISSIATSWGVEGLSKEDRFAKAVNAGIDQIGGSEEAKYIVAAVKDAKLTKVRIEQSAYRILLQKFQMGLFENAFVDPIAAVSVVGNPEFVKAGEDAQKKALILLENKKQLLPVKPAGKKVFLVGIDAGPATQHGFTVVNSAAEADLVIVRADTPFELRHPGYFFGARQHEGRLDFRVGDPRYDALVAANAAKPTIFVVNLDRPAILTNVKDKATALLGSFGISDNALLDVITGNGAPMGHLPFELPSSMQEVLAQKSDVPYDTAHPLYKFGYGLHY
jgi:beta-glucosidase